MIRYDEMQANYNRLVSSLNIQSLMAGVEYYSNAKNNDLDIMMRDLINAELSSRLGRRKAESIIKQFDQQREQS